MMLKGKKRIGRKSKTTNYYLFYQITWMSIFLLSCLLLNGERQCYFPHQLEMNSNIYLEVAFHNEKMSVWESLVEPVVENGKMKKWDLQLKVRI